MSTDTQSYNLLMPVTVISEHLAFIQETFVNGHAPDIGDLDDEQLIDLLGSFRKIKSLADKYDKTISGILKAKLPAEEEFTAGRFTFYMQVTQRTDIDRDLLKTEMGEDWYAEHCKTSEVVISKCQPIEEDETDAEYS